MPIGYAIGHRADTAEQVAKRNVAEAHSGLIYDRFLPVWDGPQESPHTASPMRDSLQEFVEGFRRRRQSPHNRALLEDHHQRLDAAASAWAVQTLDFKLQWRFASGLGAAHPIDNGFCFDDGIGVPFVAGSAVKGLCRVAAKVLEVDEETMRALLGPEDEAGSAAGDLVFFDALPSHWPELAVDIVNCHHPRYYAELFNDKKRAKARATETEDPIPVHFLVVAEGASFRFRLASRSRNRANVNDGLEWLKAGLTTLGIGAKTAVGYGVMEAVGDPTHHANR